MTTVLIEDTTHEGQWLLNLIRGQRGVIVVERDERKKSFYEASVECSAVSVDAFFDELNARIEKWPDHA